MIRRIAGTLWLAAWVAILALLLDLWSDLGGLVDERVRWWARLGIGAGPVLGYTAGVRARGLACWGSGRSHASLLRLYWLPVALAAAAAMLFMTVAERHDETRATFGFLCGYWAGFDAAIAAWPLACGRPYRFAREIPPEASLEEDGRDRSWWI